MAVSLLKKHLFRVKEKTNQILCDPFNTTFIFKTNNEQYIHLKEKLNQIEFTPTEFVLHKL